MKTLLSSEIMHSRLKVRAREAERRFLRLFNCKSSRDVKYDFAHRNVFGNGLKILDVGACESLLPLMLAKSDLIKYLDGDDVLEPEGVARLVDAYHQAGPGVGLVFVVPHAMSLRRGLRVK